MMLQLLFRVIFATLFCMQATSINSDLIGYAKLQAENLSIVVNATRFLVKDTVSEQYLGIMYSGMYAEEKAQVSIQSQQIVVEKQISSIKTLGDTSGVNISTCLVDREEYLQKLPNQIFENLATCIDARIYESDKALRRSDSLVDRFYTRIEDLMLQIDLCRSNSCVAPIIDFISTQETLMPEKIKLEITRNRGLYDTLANAMAECQENNIADYSFSTTLVINDISTCVNTLLD